MQYVLSLPDWLIILSFVWIGLIGKHWWFNKHIFNTCKLVINNPGLCFKIVLIAYGIWNTIPRKGTTGIIKKQHRTDGWYNLPGQAMQQRHWWQPIWPYGIITLFSSTCNATFIHERNVTNCCFFSEISGFDVMRCIFVRSDTLLCIRLQGVLGWAITGSTIWHSLISG